MCDQRYIRESEHILNKSLIGIGNEMVFVENQSKMAMA